MTLNVTSNSSFIDSSMKTGGLKGSGITIGGFPLTSVTQISSNIFNVTLNDPVTGENRTYTLRAGAGTGLDVGML